MYKEILEMIVQQLGDYDIPFSVSMDLARDIEILLKKK